MDPNATLAECRSIAARLTMRVISESERLADGYRLAELMEALDNWLTASGFLPDAWDHCCPDCGQTVVGLHSHLSDRPGPYLTGEHHQRPGYVAVSPGGTSNGTWS